MNTATIIRPAPGTTPRNGLPEWKPYVYRGADVDKLTPELDDTGDEVEVASLSGRPLKPHGTGGAVRRHYRHKTPLCESCSQYETRRKADQAAADVASGKTVRAVHLDSGSGRPWCGVRKIDDPVIAAPGETVTCKRCNTARGK